jgi:hypothetical protein
MKNLKIVGLLFIVAAFSCGFSSCTFYDEEDTVIIAYLKINDILESRLSKTHHSEIEQFQEKSKAVFGARLLGFSIDYDYDGSVIKSFTKKYSTGKNQYNIELLEIGITSELWNYFDQNYADAIPAKVQNVEEGRYYTISELKAKYPDYKTVEMEDFRPMELVNSIMNEKLFAWSMEAEGDVNLYTLYVYYLEYRQDKTEAQEPKQTSEITINSKIDFNKALTAHFPEGIPDGIDEKKIKATFKRLINGQNPLYTNDQQGFENFANDYFETDMFSGEDAE